MALNTTLRVMIESNRLKDEKLVRLLLKNCSKDNLTVLFNLLQSALDTGVKVSAGQRAVLLKHEKKVNKLVDMKLDFAVKRRILERQLDLRNVIFNLAYDNLFMIQSSTDDESEGYQSMASDDDDNDDDKSKDMKGLKTIEVQAGVATKTEGRKRKE
jgi:hypothetical protein